MFKWITRHIHLCVDRLLDASATQSGLLMAERRGDGLWWLLIWSVRLHHNGCESWGCTIPPPPPVEIHTGNICLFCLSHVCTEGCRRTRRRNMDSHYYESTDLQVLFDTFLTHSNLIIHQLMMIRLNRLGNKFHWMGTIIVSAALDWLKYSIKSKTNQIWHRIQTKTKINRIC